MQSERSLRLGSLLARIGAYSRFCIGDFDARELPRERQLGLVEPQIALAANVQVRTPQGIQQLIGDDYFCSIPSAIGGVNVGDQVRVTRNPNEYALYTVALRRIVDNPNRVRMGQGARLRLGTSDEFSATLRMPVIAPVNMSDAEAQANGELVERLVDDGQNQDLVVIAPHGGAIEFNTDRQAEAVTAALGCSSWICKGWKPGGGTYTRWHITSTRLSPRSFPGLGFIANRGFTWAISFHGMASGGVLIGGAGPMDLKMTLRAAILDALSDDSISVTIAKDDDKNAGDSPKNVVNWLTEDGFGGIQLEQSPKVRSNHWEEIVEAVISVYSQLLEG